MANRYKLTLAFPLVSFFMLRRLTFRRTVLLWGGLTWFVCPEWGLAYIQRKKPLTDLLEKDEEIRDESGIAT